MTAAISGMLTSQVDGDGDGEVDPTTMPLQGLKDVRNVHHYVVNGGTAMAGNSMGQPWQGDYVFNSGDLVLDLLHNFFLESGARLQKIRVYQMTDHPAARQMLGYLLVRGGVHQVAYIKALQKVTGVEISKMLNIPNISNSKFPETRDYEGQDTTAPSIASAPTTSRTWGRSGMAPTRRTARRWASRTARRRVGSRPTTERSPATSSPGIIPASWRR